MDHITIFLDGVIMMGYCVAGLCLLRFWRKSRDRFFLLFAIAFEIMAANRVLLAFMAPDRSMAEESHMQIYAVRLLAFMVLLAAIIDKNRKPRAAAPSAPLAPR